MEDALQAVVSGRVGGCCVGLQGCGEWESKGVCVGLQAVVSGRVGGGCVELQGWGEWEGGRYDRLVSGSGGTTGW